MALARRIGLAALYMMHVIRPIITLSQSEVFCISPRLLAYDKLYS